MNYKTAITSIGSEVMDFLQDNMLIVFNENAPEGLAEISILHTIAPFEKEISVGDRVVFGANAYDVTGIGTEANKTMKTLGHCTFVFCGEEKAEAPGQVCLEKKPAPELKVGDTLEIHYQ
ncbi:MAG: PTS glucitol/sorbitol transporter subunit IIA [Bacillota bacterium]